MKKLYTLLLAASVAASAVAAPAARISAKNFTPDQAEKAMVKKPDFAKKAKPQTVKLTKIEAPEATSSTSLKAPAKAAATNMAELVGIYDYSILMASGDNAGQTLSSTLDIAKGEGENEVIINGLRYVDVSIKGTVDFAKGTITIAPQVLLEMPEDPEEPGVSQNVYLITYNEDWSDEDRTANLTMTLNADGTITSDDLFVYAVEDLPGFLYTAFAYPELTPSELNTYVLYAEYDTDDEGYFQPTTTEFTSYAKAEYYTEYPVQTQAGVEDLGEVVGLSDFIYSENSQITKVWELPVIIERDYGTTYLDMFVWFECTLGTTDYEIAPGAESGDGIEGTFSENIISWDCDWFAYGFNATNGSYAGVFSKMLGCTIQLPFNVEDPDAGLKDVTVDNNSNAPIEFYNIQGMRINEPAAGQLVIRRQGNKVSKLIVK